MKIACLTFMLMLSLLGCADSYVEEFNKRQAAQQKLKEITPPPILEGWCDVESYRNGKPDQQMCNWRGWRWECHWATWGNYDDKGNICKRYEEIKPEVAEDCEDKIEDVKDALERLK